MNDWNAFGRSCTGLRKTIIPKCEDEPGCTWVVRKGCRASDPGTAPPSHPKSEMPIGNCARCAKTVKRRDCPGGVCGGNGLCHWCVGEGCKEIGYECKRAAASATKQAKAHAAREKRAKSAAEKEAARRAKEQAKAQAKQAREDAKRAKEQERRAKEAARRAKAAEAKARKAEAKAARDAQRKAAAAAKKAKAAEAKARKAEAKAKTQKEKEAADRAKAKAWKDSEDARRAKEAAYQAKARDKANQARENARRAKEKAEDARKPPRIPNCDELERHKIEGGLNTYPGCGYEKNGYYCNLWEWEDEDPAVLFYNAVRGAQWGGKYGTTPDGIDDAIIAFNEWKMVVDYYHECRAEGADVVNAMIRFYTIMDYISDQMNPNVYYSKGVHDAWDNFLNDPGHSKRRSGAGGAGGRAKAGAGAGGAGGAARAPPCNSVERWQELSHLDPLDIDINPILSEMALVWPQQYPSLPKERVSPQMDIRPHANEYMALPSRRKVELFVAWKEVADAFDKYVECKGSLSDFRQARRKFTSVAEDYRAHVDEEDVGAGGSAGGDGEYAHHRVKGVHCNKTELAKVRNYSQAIYNIWNDPKGISKAKIIKLIRDKGVPAADVKGLTKNQLVEWARQLFDVPRGEIRQEDGTRDAFEHRFAEYDLNEDRYLDELELIWAKCNNRIATIYDGDFTRPAYDYHPNDYDSQGNYHPGWRYQNP